MYSLSHEIALLPAITTITIFLRLLLYYVGASSLTTSHHFRLPGLLAIEYGLFSLLLFFYSVFITILTIFSFLVPLSLYLTYYNVESALFDNLFCIRFVRSVNGNTSVYY